MKIGLLQINPTVGDLEGNVRRIVDAARDAQAQGAELCLTPELAMCGYPPRDLLLDSGFLDAVNRALDELAATLADGPALLVGTAEVSTLTVGNHVHNSAALLQGGKVAGFFRKSLLPTYDVFDESRYFEPGEKPGVLEFQGRRLGVSICEDVWNDKDFWTGHRRYPNDPMEQLAAQGVEAMLNLSSSPFTLGKSAFRRRMLSALARKHGLPVLYANQVGGNDDLIFDGESIVLDGRGRVIAEGPAFDEAVLVVDLDRLEPLTDESSLCLEEQAWKALTLGTRDFVRKCGFSRVVLGLSGGVDSSLTAAVAVEALGAERVTGLLMPSPYSSQGSVDDSLALAENLGIQTWTLPIENMMRAYNQVLAQPFAGLAPDVTEENLQARIRAGLLMAVSNKFNAMLLTTGNKSELSVGYCTIYGDMAGGLAVIADAPKTLVYGVCRWLNEQRGEIIPTSVLHKPPSAELRPGQKDQDSLPPYEVLDPILEALVERRESEDELVSRGFDRQTVRHVRRLLKISEFKRKQAPPGLKITDRAFGSGWRMPIASKWG